MCLITSMHRKQGLIVIWGRARGAVPAHWWILMMSVFLTVCYANMGFGGGGGGVAVVGCPLSTVENCKARFLPLNLPRCRV